MKPKIRFHVLSILNAIRCIFAIVIHFPFRTLHLAFCSLCTYMASCCNLYGYKRDDSNNLKVHSKEREW